MTHKIITEEGDVITKHETMAEYGDKIPINIAIIESGFSPKDWQKVFKKPLNEVKSITRKSIRLVLNEISRIKKQNSYMIS